MNNGWRNRRGQTGRNIGLGRRHIELGFGDIEFGFGIDWDIGWNTDKYTGKGRHIVVGKNGEAFDLVAVGQSEKN
jgi:hypothetical protein